MHTATALMFCGITMLLAVHSSLAESSPNAVQIATTEPSDRKITRKHHHSLTADHAAKVLEQVARAESEAIREAVDADITAKNNREDNEQNGFRSFSELYQWAVEMSTREDGTERLNNEPDISDTLRPEYSDAIPQAVDSSSDSDLHHTSKLSSDQEPTGTCSQLGASQNSDKGSPDADRVPSRSRLQDLQVLAEDLPEFESEIVILERAVNVLKANNHATRDEVVSALDMIEDLCHSGDNGRDLHTLGGLASVVQFLQSSSDKEFQAAARTLSTCVRNNPPVAHAAADELRAIPVLLSRASEDSATAATRARSLLALAALADATPTARRQLTDHTDIASQLVKIMQISMDMLGMGKEETRSVLRSLALAETVVRETDSAEMGSSDIWKDRFKSGGITKAVQNILQSPHAYDVDVREAAARLAKALDS